MSKILEIVDLDQEGRVQLDLRNGEEHRTATPVEFRNPLDESDYQEIAWYFQDYLHNPFGASKPRAEAVETGLRDLGRLLFETVFRSSEDARNIFASGQGHGLAEFDLAVVSSRPWFLSLPWELLNEPDIGYLASHVRSLVRRRTAGTPPEVANELALDQLNVLMVCPVPEDTGHETGEGVASAALAFLDSVDAPVELHCLRPPTFKALQQHLEQRRGYYHAVLLDGFQCTNDDCLVFETPGGRAHPVAASQVGRSLSEAKVPLVIANSGRTGASNLVDSATISQGIAEEGVPSVVLVPMALTRPARELFVRSLFQALIDGADSLSAVSLARKSLMDHPLRPSPSGKVVFWDWIAPSVYQSASCRVTPIEAEKADGADAAVPSEQARPSDQLPQGGPLGLVGRSSEMRRLERMFQHNPVVLLAGNTGIGKTELALGLARWLRDTGVRPGGVFYTDFRIGAGLERVVHEVGTEVAGLDFADMNAQQQRRWLVQYLQEHPCLLVWDSLENVAGFPDPTSGLLDESEQTDLYSFLSEVADGGKSWVLLVSRRSNEVWLSNHHAVFALAGLAPRDRLELGILALDSLGIADSFQGNQADQRLGQGYLQLLDTLEGHPLAMQLALPLIKEVPASVIITELNKAIESLGPESLEESRDPYLTALADYSFTRMSRRSRVHLPFLALFQQRVMMDVLTHITQEQTYKTVLGEELGWGACRTLLRSARDAGFLHSVTPSVFQVQSSFPWFYSRKLHQQNPASAVRRLELEFVRVYADTADYFMETLYENQDAGATAVLAEEGNLTQALGLALEAQQWDSAQVLVQPLAQVYRMQKRYPELRRLRRQILLSTGDTVGQAEAKGAVDLWMYLLGTEASESADQMELDHAESLNQQLLAYLSELPDGTTDPRTAAVYHQLGSISLGRWQLAEAEEWFSRSLEIIEKGEDRAAVADDYYSLGRIRHLQRRYSEAKHLFRQALDIHQRLQDQEEMVKDYRALGLAAQYRFELDEAESSYQRAREILEEFRDEETVALVYHELGTVCHARYEYDDAESWYKQALTLSDRLGMEDQMAVEFHHLGLLAQGRELFYEDAEEWYLLALEKYEKLEDMRAVGDECRQLGVLFHEQKRLDEAEQWYQRASGIFEELQDLQRTARTYGQLGVVAEDRGDLEAALEWVARTYALATDHNLPSVDQAKAHLARLRDKYSVERFTQWWQGYTGGEPPTDL